MLEPVFYPFTIPQESIYDVERFYTHLSYTNISATVIIKENVNLDLLEKAANFIIKQHKALRLRFEEHEGIPRQYVSSFSKQKFERLDFSDPGNWTNFVDWQNNKTKVPFESPNNDLFYFALVKLYNAQAALYMKFHHHISDAWTLTLIIRDILNTYKDLVRHLPLSLEQKPSYTDYIKEDMEYRNSQKFEQSKLFWQQMFETVPEFTHLKKSLQGRNIEAKRMTVGLSIDLSEDIARFSAEFKVSGFIVFFAALSLYISKMTSKHDLVIGTPVLNRANHQQKDMVGMFICNLPFRITINPEWDFITYLYEIKKGWKQLLKNQRYPYQQILKDFRKMHGNTGALTDVFLSYQNAKFEVEGIDFESFWNFNGQEINTLSLHVSDWKDKGELRLDYDYLIEALTDYEVEQIHHYIITLLKDAISEPTKTLSQISLLTSQDKYKLVHELNNTNLDYPKEKTVHQLIEEQVEKTPERIALIFNNEKLTYRRLNERANQLAMTLRQKGVTSNSIVGIMLNRSAELIIAILAVLKAGGAYLPIDPQYPLARIEDVLRNSRTHLLLTNPNGIEQEEVIGQLVNTLGLEQINLNDSSLFTGYSLNLPNLTKPNDLAYVIYTSGSTGTPKGVMIEHRSVNNLIHALGLIFYSSEQKVIASLTTVAFDIFVLESLVPLSYGLCIVMANEAEQKIPSILFELVKKYKIEMLQATPSKIQSLLKDPNCSVGLRPLVDVFIGGEPLPEVVLKKVQKITPSARIYNMYGPTETTVWSMYKEVTQKDHVTIGLPIANTQVYILDKARELVPKGVTGEICIGGDGLARGYLYRPDLTEERFVANPFHEGQIIYKTGDLGRWTAQEEIECLGRNDNQVKVRGFRIELGEIEKCLIEHDSLQEAVVITRDGGNNMNYLCAYLVGNQACSALELRAHLEQRLPEYMIPAKFVWLDALPLTPNSKVDKKSLPDPISRDGLQDTVPIPPRNSVEEELSKLWSRALNVEHIGIDDNFFLLGGDSLAIIEILTGTWLLEWDLNAQDFYDFPTIRQLSNKLKGETKGSKGLEQLDEEFPSLDLDYDQPSQVLMPVLEGNVLLTGATGFLGMHLLWELLNNTTGTIVCLVRGAEMERRFRRLFNSYFSVSARFDYSRIRLINGDVSQSRLGLSSEDYEELGKTVSNVIHAAGLVKHYGVYSDFEKTNVQATLEVIKFCRTFGRPLNHISTVSIAGNQLTGAHKNGCFSETELYIGQNYRENLYIRSKFEAEVQVLQAIPSGLQASIFRVGILTGRYTDGHFQSNINENAFYNKLKSLLEIKAIPQDRLYQELEFTPVDSCAKGIINIIKTNTRTGRVFHMFNHKKIGMNTLIEILNSQGVEIKCLDTGSFYQLIEQYLESLHSLNGFVLDITQDSQLDLPYKIIIESNITQSYLAQTGFEWPEITENYLKKILEYMKRVGFLRQII